MNRILRGAIAGAVGSLAMNLFARAVAGDRKGHGVQPPQAHTREDATELAAATALEAVSGREAAETLEQPLGTAAHYAFGAAMGVAYALLSPKVRILQLGHGKLYGTLVWLIADEGLIPLLGLSRGPSQLPARTHAYALAGHLVYGAAMATVADGTPEGVPYASRGRRHP